MSAEALLHAESRIQKFLLGPLFFLFIAGIAISLYQRTWWAAVVFVLLCFRVGRIGAQLRMHRGKSFAELSQGVVPEIAPVSDDMLSDDELLHVVLTLMKVPVLIAAAAVIPIILSGVKIYWALLIGLGVWLVARLLGGLLGPLFASPKTLFRRIRGK